MVAYRKAEGETGAGKDRSGESRTKDGKRDSKIRNHLNIHRYRTT